MLPKYIQKKLNNQYSWLPLADREVVNWKKNEALLVYDKSGGFGVNAAALSADGFNTSDDGSYTAYDVDADEVIMLEYSDDDKITPEPDYPDTFNSQMRVWSKYLHTPDPMNAKSEDSAPDGVLAFSVSDADAKIKEFCSNSKLYNTVLTSPISTGTMQTKDGRGKALGISGSYDINGGTDKLWLGANSASGSCTGMETWPPRGNGLRDTDLFHEPV